jgi:hypothetical protein
MHGMLFVRFIALPDRMMWVCVGPCVWNELQAHLALLRGAAMEPQQCSGSVQVRLD